MAYFKVRFINGAGFVADAIDFVTNSLIDHVEIETESGSYIGAHADGGVQDRPANYCTPTWEKRYSIPCPDDQLQKIMSYARAKIGTPYDFTDIVGLLFHDRSLDSPHRLICSAFTFSAGVAGGLYLLNAEKEFAHLVTPETLHLSPLLIGNCTYSFPQ
jgi:hypothetical protein